MSFGVLAVIVCAGLGGPLLSLGRGGLVPVVVGELAAGVLVGKTGFSWVDPAEQTTAFLAAVGFAMLMFAAGMRVPIRQPGIGKGLRRGVVAAVVAGLASVPAGIGIAAILGGGHAAIYALLLAERVGGDPAAGGRGARRARRRARADGDGPGRGRRRRGDRGAAARAAAVEGRRRGARRARRRRGRGRAVRRPRTSCAATRLVHRVRKESKQRGWALDLRLALLALFVLAWLAVRSGTSVLIAGFAVGLVVALIGGPKRLSTQVTGIAAGFFIPLFFVVLGAKLDLRAVVDKPSILELTALLTVANVAVHLLAAARHAAAAARPRWWPPRSSGCRQVSSRSACSST